MWVFTETGGFYSAVTDRTVKPLNSAKMIRTRDRYSAELLSEFLEVEYHPQEFPITSENGDYAFRLRCTTEQWSRFLEYTAKHSVAQNFKSEVLKNVGSDDPMNDALHDVWLTMYNFQKSMTP